MTLDVKEIGCLHVSRPWVQSDVMNLLIFSLLVSIEVRAFFQSPK